MIAHHQSIMECRVGLPNDNQKRWRCFICSQLNLWDNNACKRCQEPVSETQKLENKLKMPQTSFQTQNKSYTNGTRTKGMYQKRIVYHMLDTIY